MMKSRIIIIGDIHGCFYSLKHLWDKIQPKYQDTIIFVGDYIDRGNHSFEVINFLREQKRKFPNLILLKGNHEDLCERAIKENNVYLWYYNGGGATVNSFEEHNADWSGLLPFISSLPTFAKIEERKLVVVHANMPTALEPEDEEYENLIWSREFKNNSEYMIVCGHTRHKHPRIYVNPNEIICIDTGCVGGGELTAAVFDESYHFPNFVSVEMDERDFGQN